MPAGGSNQIKSDRTLFDIIEQLRTLDGATVTEIADGLGLAKSTVHAHLRTLESDGYIVQRGTEYDIGLAFLDIGIYTQEKRPIYGVAKPHLVELAEETGQTAWCVVEEGGYGVFLDCAYGRYSVRTDARIGTRKHLYRSSGGRAIMGHLPRERVEEVVERRGLPDDESGTVLRREALFAELDAIRERGVAYNMQGSIRGIHAVSAPVLADDGEVRGAISVAGPANRLPPDRLENEIATMVLAAVNEIELELTYS